MGVTAAILGGASAFMTISQGYSQKKALEAQADYQRDLSVVNTRFAEAQAEDALARGDEESLLLQREVSKLIGRQRVSAASQGISVDSGTAADMVAETQQLGAMDALRIKNNAWREAWGYKVEAVNTTAAGNLAYSGLRQKGKETLLTAGAQALSQGASIGASMAGNASGGTAASPRPSGTVTTGRSYTNYAGYA